MGTRARRTPSSLMSTFRRTSNVAPALQPGTLSTLDPCSRDGANHPARSGRQVEPAPLRRQKHVGQDVDLALGLGPLGLRHARASAAILGIDFHFLQHRDARAHSGPGLVQCVRATRQVQRAGMGVTAHRRIGAAATLATVRAQHSGTARARAARTSVVDVLDAVLAPVVVWCRARAAPLQRRPVALRPGALRVQRERRPGSPLDAPQR